jgi:hypothetical protein
LTSYNNQNTTFVPFYLSPTNLKSSAEDRRSPLSEKTLTEPNVNQCSVGVKENSNSKMVRKAGFMENSNSKMVRKAVILLVWA